jgi:ankyrin repeat protein
MKYFIEELGVDPQAKDKIQQTPIYYAAREGRNQVCEYLLSKGVPINEPDLYHQTPVYYAAR